ncbi:hypothetical protein BVX98_02975, partial [bacterium F11]
MPKNNLTEHLLKYNALSHKRLYWAELFSLANADTFWGTVSDLLSKAQEQEFSNICQMLRDLVQVTPEDNRGEEILLRLHSSTVITTLEEHGSSPSFHKRSVAIMTLGNINSERSVDRLLSLFTQIKNTDPLLLKPLVMAVDILMPDSPHLKNMSNEMANATSFFTRWAILDILSSIGHTADSDLMKFKYAITSFLTKDKALCVRE